MITTIKPMSVAHARALATAYQLHQLLGEVLQEPGNAEGGPVEQAIDLMDGVIERLEPPEFDGTEPAQLGRLVGRRAVHALATKRWRP